jgi:hypothetical protein
VTRDVELVRRAEQRRGLRRVARGRHDASSESAESGVLQRLAEP